MVELKELYMVYVRTVNVVATFLVPAEDFDEAVAAASQVVSSVRRFYGQIVKVETYPTPLAEIVAPEQTSDDEYPD